MAKVNKSLYKVPLVGGVEKTPAIYMVISLCIMILYAPLYIKIFGTVVILIVWGILRKLNKHDPIFFIVAINYVLQQKFYLAQAMDTKRKIKHKLRFNP